jgi:hypothetical protein
MLEDLALASELADLSLLPPEERPKCPECGRALAECVKYCETTLGRI